MLAHENLVSYRGKSWTIRAAALDPSLSSGSFKIHRLVHSFI